MTDQMIKNFEEENLIDTKQNWLVQGNLGWMNFEQQLFSWWPTQLLADENFLSR